MALVDRASLPEMQADAHVYGFVWLCIFVISCHGTSNVRCELASDTRFWKLAQN